MDNLNGFTLKTKNAKVSWGKTNEVNDKVKRFDKKDARTYKKSLIINNREG